MSTPFSTRLRDLRRRLRREKDGIHDVEKAQQKLERMVDDFAVMSAQYRQLSAQVKNLDRKIQFSVQNQLFEDDSRRDEYIIRFIDKEELTPLGEMEEFYQKMVALLRSAPMYLASLAQNLPFDLLDSLTHITVFSLFGNLYQPGEERRLLYFIIGTLKFEMADIQQPTSFLRANTYGTKLLGAYTKRGGGKSYLVKTLRAPILEVLNLDEEDELELDPVRLASGPLKDKIGNDDLAFLSREELMDHPAVVEWRDRIAPKLQRICEHIVDNIFLNVQNLPHGIRWICKELLTIAERKWPEMPPDQRTAIAGGYTFLRFQLPAIIAPDKAFVVTDRSISELGRRNLTCVARVIEKFASVRTFGFRDVHLEFLNEAFMLKNRERLVSYVRELVNVGDPLDDYKSSMPISGVFSDEHSRKQTRHNQLGSVISISPNELYFVHRSALKYLPKIAEYVPGPGDPLRKHFRSTPKGLIAPMDIPQRDNKFFTLRVTEFEFSDVNDGDEIEVQIRSPLWKGSKKNAEMSTTQGKKKDIHSRNRILQTAIQALPQFTDEQEKSLTDLNECFSLALMLSEKNGDKEACDIFEYALEKISGMDDSDAEETFLELERAYNERETYRNAVASDVLQLGESLQDLKKESDGMVDEIRLYDEYLSNVMNQNFVMRVRSFLQAKEAWKVYPHRLLRVNKPGGSQPGMWSSSMIPEKGDRISHRMGLPSDRVLSKIVQSEELAVADMVGPLFVSMEEMHEMEIVLMDLSEPTTSSTTSGPPVGRTRSESTPVAEEEESIAFGMQQDVQHMALARKRSKSVMSRRGIQAAGRTEGSEIVLPADMSAKKLWFFQFSSIAPGQCTIGLRDENLMMLDSCEILAERLLDEFLLSPIMTMVGVELDVRMLLLFLNQHFWRG